jgi:hypothetical protein
MKRVGPARESLEQVAK